MKPFLTLSTSSFQLESGYQLGEAASCCESGGGAVALGLEHVLK